MAYKPKYAQRGSAPKPDVIREPVEVLRKPKKAKKGVLILFILLGLVVVPASTWLTVRMMGDIFENVGRPKPAAVNKSADMQILQQFEETVTSRLTAVRNSMRPADLERFPEQLQPTEETLPPVRKQYWIEEGTLVAPEPNQALFGRTDDPEVMAQVLHDAQWLLDGQTTYFQPNQKLYEDSIVRYYLDDSIFAITWQEVHDGSVYTFSEIKVSHPSQFRRHLAGGEYGSDMPQKWQRKSMRWWHLPVTSIGSVTLVPWSTRGRPSAWKVPMRKPAISMRVVICTLPTAEMCWR